MEKVAKASGANYNFHREPSKFQDSGPQAPVVSFPGDRWIAQSQGSRVGELIQLGSGVSCWSAWYNPVLAVME